MDLSISTITIPSLERWFFFFYFSEDFEEMEANICLQFAIINCQADKYVFASTFYCSYYYLCCCFCLLFLLLGFNCGDWSSWCLAPSGPRALNRSTKTRVHGTKKEEFCYGRSKKDFNINWPLYMKDFFFLTWMILRGKSIL